MTHTAIRSPRRLSLRFTSELLAWKRTRMDCNKCVFFMYNVSSIHIYIYIHTIHMYMYMYVYIHIYVFMCVCMFNLIQSSWEVETNHMTCWAAIFGPSVTFQGSSPARLITPLVRRTHHATGDAGGTLLAPSEFGRLFSVVGQCPNVSHHPSIGDISSPTDV